MTRLLANFQSSLQEITVIATEQSARAADDGGEIGGKAVELRSYIDPTKDDGDMVLHTQLWIDPAEEFLQYTHAGDPVDVTFGVKELKAFLTFCEGCEADIQIFFEKAGEPILMAPRFGFDGASSSDFDATLVLASMLVSQLNDETIDHHPAMASGACEMGTEQEPARAPSPVSDRPSNHTKIWSDLTGSAAKSSDGTRERHIQTEGNPSSTLQNNMQNLNVVGISKTPPARENLTDIRQAMETDNVNVNPDEPEANRNCQTQHHPSNWVGACDDDEEEEEDEVYVQSTPHFYD